MDAPNIQWFPGHMQKARRLVEENLRTVDAVIELVDARVPLAARNPMLGQIIGKKPKVIALTKADLADERETLGWLKFFSDEKTMAVAVDVKSGAGLKKLFAALKNLTVAKTKKFAAASGGKTNVTHIVRAMAVGIPNVGKSSLINKLAGKTKANVENRPGVTRAKQWIRVGKDLELLDMPGVLWPKFADPAVGAKLALIGAVRDEVYDGEALAKLLLKLLVENESYKKMLVNRFSLADQELPTDTEDILRLLGKKRGMLVKGGTVDEEKTAAMLLKEFRDGKLGRISLESVNGADDD